jgi:hypothetical protein
MASIAAQSAAKELAGRVVDLPPLPPAAVDGPPGCLRPFVNEALNGRLSAPLGAGSFTEDWSAPVDPLLRPLWLLASGRQSVIVGREEWQAFQDRKPLPLAMRGGDDAEWLPAQNVILQPNRLAELVADPISGGDPHWSIPLHGANETLRGYIHRRGDHIVVEGYSESRSPHNPETSLTGYLEVLRPDGEQIAFRDLENARIRVAMHNDFIIAARPGAVDYLDYSLQSQRRITFAMLPQAISLDETGRAYVLALIDGRQQLAILTAAGEVSLTPMPVGFTAYHRPPVVGLDHRVYLLGAGRVFSPGTPTWSYETPARLAGATVTADGLLLLAAGDAVLALDNKGAARPIARTPGDELMAPPILGAEGELLFLTRKALHCWRRK